MMLCCRVLGFIQLLNNWLDFTKKERFRTGLYTLNLSSKWTFTNMTPAIFQSWQVQVRKSGISTVQGTVNTGIVQSLTESLVLVSGKLLEQIGLFTPHGTTKCIGLKKSLVFYRGRATKGFKTDWMMREFRLPSTFDSSNQPNKLFDKSLPPNDSWAICRIFKKANSMAQRALSYSWVSGLPEIAASDIIIQGQEGQFTLFSNEIEPAVQFCTSGHLQQQTSKKHGEIPNNGFVFSSQEMSGITTCSTVDATSILFNPNFKAQNSSLVASQ